MVVALSIYDDLQLLQALLELLANSLPCPSTPWVPSAAPGTSPTLPPTLTGPLQSCLAAKLSCRTEYLFWQETGWLQKAGWREMQRITFLQLVPNIIQT